MSAEDADRRAGASEIATSIRERRVSAREVVDTHIRRIEAVNGSLNALVIPRFDQARAEAAAADERQARGEPLGPLHGVPVTVKENIDVAGSVSSVGVRRLAERAVTTDSPLVARLRRAGAIVLGKTNVAQLLAFVETDNPVYGRTSNPWQTARSAGGSTGGEAALIAAGASPLGLGTDIGGSLRVPAHFCGVHSLKPTSGRLSLLGTGDVAVIARESWDQPGPLARRVEDLSLAMTVLAAPGLEHVDPHVPPVPWPDPSTVDLSHLRVGLYVDDGTLSVSPAIRRAVHEAGAALRARGLDVQPFVPQGAGRAMQIFGALYYADGGAKFRRILGGGPVDPRVAAYLRVERLPSWVHAVIAPAARWLGQGHLADQLEGQGQGSPDRLAQLLAELQELRMRFLASLADGGFAAIICPTFPVSAMPHGGISRVFSIHTYSAIFNLFGMPAGVVAATRVRVGEESDRPSSRDGIERALREFEHDSAGLPVGVQVAAPPWREDVVLALMKELETHFRAQPDYPAQPPI